MGGRDLYFRRGRTEDQCGRTMLTAPLRGEPDVLRVLALHPLGLMLVQPPVGKDNVALRTQGGQLEWKSCKVGVSMAKDQRAGMEKSSGGLDSVAEAVQLPGRGSLDEGEAEFLRQVE